MKQIDIIRNMTAEEMAEMIISRPYKCNFCDSEDGVSCWYANTETCKRYITKWLESEVADNDNK